MFCAAIALRRTRVGRGGLVRPPICVAKATNQGNRLYLLTCPVPSYYSSLQTSHLLNNLDDGKKTLPVSTYSPLRGKKSAEPLRFGGKLG